MKDTESLRSLCSLIDKVRSGTMSRRSFIRRMAGLGLSAPLANQMLLHAGIAQAQTSSTYAPTKRGGGGALRTLFWQAPTGLNPQLATGLKDYTACRIFYEPLASYDPDGGLVPVLAESIPSAANGGLAKDHRSLTWTLKRNVRWHDGQPFTADDVVFTWEYVRNPAVTASSIGIYGKIHVSKVDDFTVRVEFDEPRPDWVEPAFVGTNGMVLPKHRFADYAGSNSDAAPANVKPVGTGPYRFVDFKPGDMVRGELNPNYHMPNRPFFDTIEIKGGGDAVSAARAVMQTGEYDYAWSLQVEDEILARMEAGGKGRVVFTDGNNLEYIQINSTDPRVEVDGERSSLKTRHPCFSDPAVRHAMSLLVDRKSIQDYIYGRSAVATANVLNSPARFRSPNTQMEFDIGKAEAVLESAGWKRGPDGIRAKDGKRLAFLFQTTTNAPRQKTQQIVKQACQKAGIDLEIKAVTPGVFFSTDPANPDTMGKFYADLQMYAFPGGPDPGRFMGQFCSWEAPTKANNWRGINTSRWRNEEYDSLYRASVTELDPIKRAALMIRMNDLLASTWAVIPVVARRYVRAVSRTLVMPLSAWDSDFASLHDWYKTDTPA